MQLDKNDVGMNLSRAKIMIVDDDPELRMALKLRLRANQYEAVSVCDGYSAIALAQKERPNLIILDLWFAGWERILGAEEVARERLSRVFRSSC